MRSSCYIPIWDQENFDLCHNCTCTISSTIIKHRHTLKAILKQKKYYMVAWVIIVLVVLFLAVILWLLLATITLTVDTTANKYSIVWVGLFQGRLQMVGEKIYVIVRAPFFTKRFDLEQKVIQQITKAQKPVREVKDKSPKRTHTSGRFIWKKFRKNWLRILKSFKVRRFRINIDTDNFITNSLIFPSPTLPK